MPWNRRDARFYCEVDSQRMHREIILSNERRGLHILAAGEQGSLSVHLTAHGHEENIERNGPKGGVTKHTFRNKDRFEVWFKPWRSCDNSDGPSILIASGPLDYDRVKMGEAMVRFDDRAIEVYRTIRAMEIMEES